MLSRDMKVQAGVVTLAILVGYVGENVLNIRAGDGSVSIPLLLLMYGIAFGGTHFYLAPHDYDDSVPVGTRWRYVVMVIVILGAGAISIVDESTGATIAVLAVFVYLLVEVISGYQQFMMNQH
jgi:hypothetical protein